MCLFDKAEFSLWFLHEFLLCIIPLTLSSQQNEVLENKSFFQNEGVKVLCMALS